jgi:CRP-like cAMP-binding protein
LTRILDKNAALRRSLLRYCHTFLVQTANTAFVNGSRRLDERLARWLLMAHDRIGRDELPLTHEFLGIMLGVRRAGVTVGLRQLEDRGLIVTQRGQVTINDRSGLETLAASAYGLPEAEYERVFAGGSARKG